jgi:phytoene synthase
MALHAFNAELARVADTVSETIIGQMRFQWWRDQITQAGEGIEPIKGHPVGEGVNALIRRHGLDAEDLLSVIDARETDLDARPFATDEDLLCHARVTSGAVNRCAARLLGTDTPELLTAAEDVGTAWGLISQVRVCLHDARRGRLSLPTDALARVGLTLETLAKSDDGGDLRPELRRILGLARERLAQARTQRKKVTMATSMPFLLMKMADHYLDILEENDASPNDPRLAVVPRMPFRLFWAAIGKRF